MLAEAVLASLLVFGSASGVSATDVKINDGDTLQSGTNITVTKDDGTKTITIGTTGLATTTELDGVKTDVTQNKTDIAKNTTAINTNKTDIAGNKEKITALEEIDAYLGLSKNKPGMKYFRANSTGDDAKAEGTDAVAIGVKADAKGAESVVMGDAAKSTDKAYESVTIGKGAVSGATGGMPADEGSTSVIVNGGKKSISIGTGANARGNASIALGDGAVVQNDGANNQVNSNSMAIGTEAKTVASGNAMAIGYKASVAKNSDSAIAFGDNAKTGAADAVAVGKAANASGADSLAVGTSSAASGPNAVALGNIAQATSAGAIAIGNGAVTAGGDSVSLGTAADAAASRSVAIGPSAGAGMVGDTLGTKGSHVVIGDGAGQNTDGQQNVSIGYKTGDKVKSDYNIAIGSEAGTNIGVAGNTSNGKNVSIGYHSNKNDNLVSRTQTTAVGGETQSADDAVAVGYQAQAIGNGSTAVGFNAKAENENSLALGQGAHASGGNVAIGNGSVANAAMISGTGYLTGQAAPSTGVSVGTSIALRRITNVADGAQDQDAVTVAQLKKSIDETVAHVNAHVSSATASGVNYDTVTSGDGESITLKNTDNKGTKIHNVAAGSLDTDAANVKQVNEAVYAAKTHYYAVKSSMKKGNYDDDLAAGDDSMAAGINAKALEKRSVAMGNNTEAQSVGSISLGTGYEDAANPGTVKQTQAIAGYQYNTAIGAGAQAAGNSSMAIGTLATSSIKNGGSSVDKAVAIGYSAGVSDDKAIAVGSDAKSNSKSATAMGDTAQALNANALAIGTTAKAEGASSGAIGTNNYVKGENTYVLGAENDNSGAASDGVAAVNSGIFGNSNNLEGDSNRIVGNSNKVEKASMAQSGSKKLEDIMVTGNGNVVSGDPDTTTAGDAGDVTGITVTGSKNKVVAKNNKGKNLTDIQIVGNNNEIDTSDKDRDLSNTQILGSNVNATLGNSAYIGSGSAYVVSGTTTKGMETYFGNGTYSYAGGTPAGVVTVGSVGKERRIQNVASGLVSNTSTDAVNGSQLYNMTLPLRFAGDNSTIGATASADNNVLQRGSDQAMSILGGADGTKLSDNNIGVVADAANNKMTVKLAKNLKNMSSAEFKDDTKTTTVNGSGVTITPSAGDATKTVSLTDKGLNNGGNQITNVASGGDVDTNGANIGDVKNAINNATTSITNNLTDKGFGLKAEDGTTVHKKLGEAVDVVGDGKNIYTKVSDGKVQVIMKDDITVTSVTAKDAAGNTTITTGTGTTITKADGGKTVVDASGITITPKSGSTVSLTDKGLDNGGNQIHNVATGIAGTDAVNVDQLKKEIAANKTILKDGKNTTVTGTGTATDPYKVNVNDNLNLGEKGTNGKDGSIGVNGKDGYSVTINGKDGSIGMAGKDGKDGLTMKAGKGQDGVDGKNGTDGMTRIIYTDDKNKTHEVATLDDGLKFAGNTGSVAKKLNETMTIKGTGAKADSEYDSSNIKTMVNKDGDMIIGLDKNLKADTVTVGGKGADGTDGVDGSIGVKGKDGKDGVTISSVGKDGANGTDGHIGINGKDGASADIHVAKGANGVDGTDGYNGKDGIDRIVYEDHNGHTQTVATMNDGMKYGGDTGAVINKKLNGQVNVIGGISDTSKLTADDNIGVVSDGSNNLKVRLSKDLKGLDTVTTKTITADTGNITTVNATTVKTGDTTMTDKGVVINNGPSMTKEGVDAGNKTITNVAPGVNPTDAVNVSQLNKLGTRVNRVGAGAAALAALHPLDFDPDDKWDVAAGYGNYKDAHAVAVGAFYRPNEDTMLSVGGSFGGGENMVNAGVSVKLGQTNHVSRSRVALAKEVEDLKTIVKAQSKEINEMKNSMSMGAVPKVARNVGFPDVPKDHWAYQYVKSLAERGMLEGYPDGEFKGDRTMTRYEFAAIIYRALQNGAPVDGTMGRAIGEFGPEINELRDLDRIRIDRISGKDNDRHKVERVRINDEDNKAQNDYRDVYGSHITK